MLRIWLSLILRWILKRWFSWLMHWSILIKPIFLILIGNGWPKIVLKSDLATFLSFFDQWVHAQCLKNTKKVSYSLQKIVFKSFCVKSNVRNHGKKSVLITKPLPFYGSMRQFWQFLNTMTKLETVLIFLSFLFQSMPQCRDLLLHCSWQSQEIDCLRLFKVMTTDDGFCCLFNAYKQGDVMKEMNLT